MKRIFKDENMRRFEILVLVILLVLAGCTASQYPGYTEYASKKLALTQEVSGFSKTYGYRYETALRATINSLQDLGYSISQVNDRVGLILAAKESDKVTFSLFDGTADRVIIKASVSVESFDIEKTKVKLILTEECYYHGTTTDRAIFGLSGAVKEKVRSETIRDKKSYDIFFMDLNGRISPK